MKIFTRTQISELDKYTIEHEPIRSLDLMERAARALVGVITNRWSSVVPIVVFAGPGNNGGDALAVARLLAEQGYKVSVYLFNIRNNLTADCAANKQRLLACKRLGQFVEVTVNFDPPVLNEQTLVVDGLFGSGLNKPLSGGFSSLVKYINQSRAQVVSIDLPSGLMPEDNTYSIRANIVRATLTLTFQQRKLAMMFADNQPYIGELQVLDIHLSPDYIAHTDSRYRIVEEDEIRSLLRRRDAFAHKGDMGHVLLVAGSYGMSGAAILAAKACLRSGAGKLTVHTPRRNYDIMHIAVPEAVMQMDHEETYFSEAVGTEDYDALGIGPGLGKHENTAIALIAQLRRTQCSVVADADALNILGNHRAWMQQLPKHMVMTPHPAELDRMAGMVSNGCYERLQKASEMATQLQAYIILKGHYSALCTPGGQVIFNPTGNPGMATAGSGDVLTGILTALLARGYQKEEACLLGMYLHGLAGDLAAAELGEECLVASDIIAYLPKAFHKLS